jgi:hypothetical protein
VGVGADRGGCRMIVAVVFVVICVLVDGSFPSFSYFPIFPSCFKHDDQAQGDEDL